MTELTSDALPAGVPAAEARRNGAAAGADRRPHLVIRPRSGWAALQLGAIWEFRDLLLSLASRDIKLRYRQAALGSVWVVLQPLLISLVLAFVFGNLADLPSNGLPYVVFVFAGFLTHNTFSNTLGRAAGSLVSHGALISKVYFPRLVLPLSTVISALVDLAVGLVILGIVMAIEGVAPGAELVLLPVWLLVLLLFSTGLGLVAAALMVQYRDIGLVIPVIQQFLFFASPVGYDPSIVPNRYDFLYNLNPLTPILGAIRWSLFGVGDLRVGFLAFATAVSVVLFVGGALFFRRYERRFADVI